MRILHVINTLSAGGAELHLVSRCRHLRQEGEEVVVACLREAVSGSHALRPDFEQQGIRVINLGAGNNLDWLHPARLVRLIKEYRPRILHTHLPRADIGGALARFVCPPVPWVCSVHDIYGKSWSGKWALPLFDLGCC